MGLKKIRESFDRRPLLTSTTIGGAVGLAAAASVYALEHIESAIPLFYAANLATLGGGLGFLWSSKASHAKAKLAGIFVAGAMAGYGSVGTLATEQFVNSSVCVPFNTETQKVLNQYPNVLSDEGLKQTLQDTLKSEIDTAYTKTIDSAVPQTNNDESLYGGANLPISYIPFKSDQSNHTQICESPIRDKFKTATIDQAETVGKVQANFKEIVDTYIATSAKINLNLR